MLALVVVYGVKTPDGLEIGLKLPQETLAKLTGVSRPRVNQLLKSWEKDGLILQRYDHITLIDVPRIEVLAEPHLIT